MSDPEQATSHPYDDGELDKLARKRPSVFKNVWVEIGFCACILCANILAEFLISGFNVLLPNILENLDIDEAKRTWPANVFSLVTGALLLPAGRLADMYGGYIVFVSGLVWMAIWSLFTGFSRNYIMLVLGRALQGVGAAAFLPSGIMLLASAYRPGPRKNLVFSIYGACAPFGFFLGIALAGVTGQYLTWSWFFWIGTMVMCAVIVGTWFFVPRDRERTNDMNMDWLGTVTSVSALILLVYGITNSSHLTWTSTAILVPFLIGIVMLFGFVYVEWKIAKHPILPLSLFAQKGMTPLAICMFLSFGSFGIYLFYAAFYLETVLHLSTLLSAAWFSPLPVGGILIGTIGGLFLHLLPGTMLMLLSVIGFLISNLLFALIPENPNYWAWIMPAMVCATIGVDIMFNVTNIYLTTNIPQSQQGLAGAFINVVLYLGMSFVLGFADYGVSRKADLGLKGSYNVAFWLGVGVSGVSLLIVLFWIRIGRASSDLTFEEKEELRQEALRERNRPEGNGSDKDAGDANRVEVEAKRSSPKVQ